LSGWLRSLNSLVEEDHDELGAIVQMRVEVPPLVCAGRALGARPSSEGMVSLDAIPILAQSSGRVPVLMWNMADCAPS
jgi:hypothetical protein